MNIKFDITIDDKITNVCKKLFSGKGLIISTFIIITFATIIGLKAQTTTAQELIEFVPGGKIYATDINNNFKLIHQGLHPAGTILAYAGKIDQESLPDGYLPCNGQAVNKTDYPKLYDVIGDMWGVATLDTQFLLPDLRGRFLRGLDAEQILDKGSRYTLNEAGDHLTLENGYGVGSYQDDEVQSHYHNINMKTKYNGDVMWNRNGYASSGRTTGADHAGSSSTTYSPNSQSYGGAETRPVNAAVNYIIKY